MTRLNAASLMRPEHFGIFRACRDAVVDGDLETSGKALAIISRLHGVEALPKYSPGAVQETVDWLLDLQDEETGLFVDPGIEQLAPQVGQVALSSSGYTFCAGCRDPDRGGEWRDRVLRLSGGGRDALAREGVELDLSADRGEHNCSGVQELAVDLN